MFASSVNFKNLKFYFLKGNLQRSKIIVDGLNEAQNQVMKVIDHKVHVTNIIDRCSSKRNFKKRDK